MVYRAAQFRMAGAFEPEGMYLQLPLAGPCRLLQGWGEHPLFHARFLYNGVPLKGHPGVDLVAAPGTGVLATDQGRVVTLSNEPNGFGRYIKLEHRWGESLYAHLGTILVESGQRVERGQLIAEVGPPAAAIPPHLHFGIRTIPFNRFDGWGGFGDPWPFLYLDEQRDDTPQNALDEAPEASWDELPSMLDEKPGMRRP